MFVALFWARSVAAEPLEDEPAAPAVVRQQQPEDPWRDRPLAFFAHLGLATPVGLAGIGVDYSLSFLSVEAAIGSNITGPQLALTTRFRLARIGAARTSAFYVGAGASGGPHFQNEANGDGVFSFFTGPLHSICDSCAEVDYRWDVAYWANVEIGIDSRATNGFSVRPYLGLTRLLNETPTTTDVREGPISKVPVSTLMAYAGVAIGFAL